MRQSTTTITITIIQMFHTHAGRKRRDALRVNLFQTAQLARKRMVPFASITAKMASLALAQSAGRIALMTQVSVMTVPTVTSLMPTDEVPVKFISADQAAKSGATSGTPSAMMASIMSAAASARQTARLA